MLNTLKHYFGKTSEKEITPDGKKAEHDIRVATCALFVELARIDEEFSPAELEAILSILNEKYGLSKDHAQTLLAETEKELEESVDLWQFSNRINRNYSMAEKLEIVEMLWRIVYVDGKMDQYEHYLMNKLKNLLHLTHKQLIDAKLKVLQPR